MVLPWYQSAGTGCCGNRSRRLTPRVLPSPNVAQEEGALSGWVAAGSVSATGGRTTGATGRGAYEGRRPAGGVVDGHATAAEEKAFVAERDIAAIRSAVIAFN